MSCDVDEVTESLGNELCSFSKLSITSPTSQLILILQAFPRFTYVTPHPPTLPSLYLRHNSFSNPSVASPTSQLILQPFFRISHVTGFSLTSPGEQPMKFSFQKKAIRWLDLELKENNSILDRDLNPGLKLFVLML